MDPVKRIAKWNAKYNTERIKATLDDLRPGMLESVTFVFPLLAAMELEVKQVLDQEGVSIIEYPFYLSFGRELWRLKRMNVSGESLAAEAAILIGKWVARGLSQSVLETIRTQVFDIGAPTP
ncbi:MAG: hypothetical protein ABIL25_00870 [candidate division WOR-3 bacterium]